MAVRRLNHAVLRVTDVERARDFWAGALGMEVVTEMPGAAFLRLPASGNHHDLGLFAGRGAPPAPGGIGLYHLAFEVESFADLSDAPPHPHPTCPPPKPRFRGGRRWRPGTPGSPGPWCCGPHGR
jgi:catechol 2,3-dioxygenase-like lactoylglutathione lyase family enzyme